MMSEPRLLSVGERTLSSMGIDTPNSMYLDVAGEPLESSPDDPYLEIGSAVGEEMHSFAKDDSKDALQKKSAPLPQPVFSPSLSSAYSSPGAVVDPAGVLVESDFSAPRMTNAFQRTPSPGSLPGVGSALLAESSLNHVLYDEEDVLYQESMFTVNYEHALRDYAAAMDVPLGASPEYVLASSFAAADFPAELKEYLSQ